MKENKYIKQIKHKKSKYRKEQKKRIENLIDELIHQINAIKPSKKED